MRRWIGRLVIAALLASMTWIAACGSGYEVTKGEEVDEDELPIIGTLTGVIDYQGERHGDRLVVGLIGEWPMTGPPVDFWDIENFDGTFPVTYEVELNERRLGNGYYVAAFLDVDPDDVNLMMNAELDPMDLPDQGEKRVVIQEGVNVANFVLQDPEDIDFWWDE